MTTLGNYGDIV